ncbi:adenylate/guanylate cyclase domain-containing protein [bacterium]|nr:adenylate/guanylate cyclase domain-containing protein [candidate division CSSED10-310 bacterium]
MNKFLLFDKELGIFRLPLAYSLGDLDRIRNMFGEHSVDASIALPKLPPQIDIIDNSGTLGYMVYPPFDLSSKIKDFLEKTVVHVRELKGKGYDYQHPLFKNYLKARDDCVSYLAEHLEFVVNQERRLGIFNIFWLAITKQIIISMEEVLVNASGSHKLRYMIHPHLKSMLNQVLDMVYEKLEFKDNVTRQNVPFYRGTLKSKLGANFNFNFVNDILNVQLSILEQSISPLDPLFQIRKILVDENSEYYISLNDFMVLYESILQWMQAQITEKNDWIQSNLARILGIDQVKLAKLNINSLIFEPEIIFSLQETLKQIPVWRSRRSLSLRKRTLLEEIGDKVWDQVFLDYIKLAKELQKAEIIGYFRDRIILLGSEYWRTGEGDGESANLNVEGLKGHVTYNFNSGTVINDLRKVTMMFIDLRGFTEIAAELISVQQLKQALYSFFDPTLDIIDHFNGSIRFFAGDAILATFSESNKSEDRILNAVRSGIFIQRLLRDLVQDQKIQFEGVGIGIHMGQVENAYIFKDQQEKIDTVIGLAANIASRLSSGKSAVSERRGDPTLIRALQDTLQDILEIIMGKVSPNLRGTIVHCFENRLSRLSGEGIKTDFYMDLPKLKKQAGMFRVSVVGGMLDNSGVVLSDDCFNEVRKFYEFRSRPRGEDIEFVFSDPVLNEEIVFWRAGDALLKGIEDSIPVWGVAPAKGQ